MKMFKGAIVLMLIIGLSLPAFCAETLRTAQIADMEGNVSVKRADGAMEKGEIGMVLNQGDLIKTRRDSYALIKFKDFKESATVEMEENSELLMVEMVMDKEEGIQKTFLDLSIGKVLVKADKLHKKGSRFEVKTPTSVVGVRGTTFAVEVEAIE